MQFVLIVIAAGMAFGQDAKLQFEVASMKPAAADKRVSIRGGPGTDDPGQFTCVHCSTRGLIMRALDTNAYQLSEPAGTVDVFVDVAAKIPPGTTKEQFNTMLWNLLVERFGIRLHHETRELTGYGLMIVKGGLKMQEVAAPTDPETRGGDSIKFVQSADGKPLLAPGHKARLRVGLGGGRQRLSARLQDMTDIVQMCESMMGKTVINETGLKGVYDFYVDFAPLGRGGGDSSSSTAVNSVDDVTPPFEIAIESAMGLKLQPKKLQLEVTVIDQMSKTPIEN